MTGGVMKKSIVLFLFMVSLSWPLMGQPGADNTSPEKSSPANKDSHKLVLTRRANNGQYGTSAYSFRHQTQELEVHRNNVDLVFNGCGQLHINPHAGLQGGITDIGEADLEKITLADARKVPRQAWKRFCLLPKDGHVYIHEGRYLNQQFTVAFKIKVITPVKLGLQWRLLSGQEGEEIEYRYTSAGTMGQCGGAHLQR